MEKYYTATTHKNWERAVKRRLEEAEKVEQEKRAKAGEVKANWLLENGFNETGVTYVYIADDSYNRKDELKAAGWRYHALIGWHIGEVNVPHNEEDIYILDADTAAEFNMYGDGNWKYTVKDIIAEAKVSLKAQSRSEWVGKIGERLQNISVTLTSIYGYNNEFGYSQVVKFETENKDELVWFTSSVILAKIGEKRILKGTVKKHDLYKGSKVTILTRCKII